MPAKRFTELAEVPEIILIVLRQAARRRFSGAIDDSEFERQLERLRREELAPRGFLLVVTPLPPGRVQFTVVHQPTQMVRAALSCPPEPALCWAPAG